MGMREKARPAKAALAKFIFMPSGEQMAQSTEIAILILAAGRGTRMKSEKPKVLHHLMGRPLVEHVIKAALHLGPERLVLVTGYGADEVESCVSAFLEERAAQGGSPVPRLLFVRQAEQLGTGHAVAQTMGGLADFSGRLLIMSGDVPLISPSTLDCFVEAHQNLGAKLSVLTASLEDPAAYGRVIRDEKGWLERIVEYRDASEEQRRVKEINTGLYLADSASLFQSIENLSPKNDQKEYYLTDVAADFRRRGLLAAAVEINNDCAFELRGINDRYELAQAQGYLRQRINEAWMRAGVTMMDPGSIYIESQARLAADVTLWPGVVLTGPCVISSGAEIGPYCRLHNCVVPAGMKVPAHQSRDNYDFEEDL